MEKKELNDIKRKREEMTKESWIKNVMRIHPDKTREEAEVLYNKIFKAPTEVETFRGTLHIGGDALGWQRDIDQWTQNEKDGKLPVTGREKQWRFNKSQEL